MLYRELVLLEKLLALTAADADLEYSILTGKLDADDVRAIHQGLQVAIETLQGKATAARCADCAGPIGLDDGPKDGWQLEDGRTVCQRCCSQDLIRFADRLKAQSESVAALQTALATLQKATQG